MADITKVAQASMDTSTGMFAPQICGDLYAGEILNVAAPCYIKIADGKVYQSNGAAATEAANVHGFAPRTCQIGQAVTLMGRGARFRYGTALVVGKLYVGSAAGLLADAATTGGTTVVAHAISATDIVVGAPLA